MREFGTRRRSVSLLVIDLDGFKAIKRYHATPRATPACSILTLMTQTRLRPADMPARTGGEEFCVVLPASTVREGAMVASRILEVCRQDAAACVARKSRSRSRSASRNGPGRWARFRIG